VALSLAAVDSMITDDLEQTDKNILVARLA